MIEILGKTKEALKAIPNLRIKDVLARRFGLTSGQRETLESIGQDYKITRERVRQIEEGGLQTLKDSGALESLYPGVVLLDHYLSAHGDLRREEKIFEDLYQAARKTKKPLDSLSAAEKKDFGRYQGAFMLILTLGEPFDKFAENRDLFAGWTKSQTSFKKAQTLLGFLIENLLKIKQAIPAQDIFDIAKQKQADLSSEAVISYIDASKYIFENNFGDYGLIDWPEISPRGVKDRAYLVLKKEGQSMHFRQITDQINKLFGTNKKAYVQTVHNELIKDPRFVLIGRGTYALSEWGYQPGTVLDVIQAVIKEEGPQTKEELLKKVLQKRLVKENTVLINLQNRSHFARSKDGRYVLA